jgi:hypothetical protein
VGVGVCVFVICIPHFIRKDRHLVAVLFTSFNVGRGHDIYIYPVGMQVMPEAFLVMSSV